ncbi:MAG: diacylglycerol kinase [Alphaproteobacteria bacterium]|nr:diacylglycerol kinase [Alphaproteobacteria bacterium]
MKSKYTGINRIIHAFGYSFSGLASVFRTEAAFRQDLILCIIGIAIQFFIDVPTISHILMIFSLVFIILAELINTAIETVVDRIGPEKNKLSKRAKDIGSAIVFITITSVVLLWIYLIFLM